MLVCAVTPTRVRLLAAACLSTALASCAPVADRVAPQDTAVFNVSEDPHSLDPLLARGDDERQLAHLSFDLLLDVDASGKLVPALAAQVPNVFNGGVSRDGRTITYHLRHGVRWQDGAPFTAADVAFTYRAIVDPRNDVVASPGYRLITSVDTPNPFLVVLRLSRPWAPAVATFFSYGTAPMPILPAHLLERAGALGRLPFDRAPVGTGAYRLVRWDRGQELVYAANPAYYRGAPRTPRIVVRVVPDTNTDLLLLRTGELDWSLLSPAQRAALQQARDIHFHFAPLAGFGALAFNCRRGRFFAAASARRAVAMAIDRHALSAGVTAGQYPITDSDQPPFSWAYDRGVRLPAFDERAADRALDALGWRRGASGARSKSGQPLQLVFAVFPESDTALRTAVYVQELLRRRGIGVTIKRVTLAQFYLPAAQHGVLMSGDYDIAYFAWRSGADPDDSDLVTCGAAANYSGLCDRRIDALERSALSELDQTARAAAYGAIQRLLAQDLPYDFLYAPRYGYAARDGFLGLAPTPFSATWNSYQWSKR